MSSIGSKSETAEIEGLCHRVLDCAAVLLRSVQLQGFGTEAIALVLHAGSVHLPERVVRTLQAKSAQMLESVGDSHNDCYKSHEWHWQVCHNEAFFSCSRDRCRRSSHLAAQCSTSTGLLRSALHLNLPRVQHLKATCAARVQPLHRFSFLCGSGDLISFSFWSLASTCHLDSQKVLDLLVLMQRVLTDILVASQRTKAQMKRVSKYSKLMKDWVGTTVASAVENASLEKSQNRVELDGHNDCDGLRVSSSRYNPDFWSGAVAGVIVGALGGWLLGGLAARS